MIDKAGDLESDSQAGTVSDTTQTEAGNGHDARQTKDDWQDELSSKLTFERLWRGVSGKFVITCGVALPALMILVYLVVCSRRLTLVFFDHPLETFAELLLAVNIPIAIYVAWSHLARNSNGYSLLRGISIGAAMGASMILASLSIGAVVVLNASDLEFGTGFGLLFLPWILSAAAGGVVVERVRRTRDFSSSRARILLMTAAGIALSLLVFVGAEGKQFLIRIAEQMAVSSNLEDEGEGLKRLRAFYPEREMLIECSDERAAGLCGLFLPLSLSSQRELYFAMTGEPFSFRDVNNEDLASISDQCLAHQVLGDRVSGLSLVRSSINGVVHPQTLSSTIGWTFVFKNNSAKAQEARAEIAIPHGGVVTKLTLWNKGEPQDALFCDPSQSITSSVVGTVAMVTDLGHGRMLISCAGVPAQSELKLRLTAVIPLKPDAQATAMLGMPRFIATNFDLTGGHQIRLRSPLAVGSALEKLKISSTATGEKLITGALTAKDLSSSDLMFNAGRPESPAPVAAKDTVANDGQSYIQQSVSQVPAHIPTQLVIVLDGSVKVDENRDMLAAALKDIPKNVPASVIIASSQASSEDEPLTVAQAIDSLKANRCVGGQDNLKAMIKAAEVAGETKGGAVLWIHGPQPATNREIYIMGQYEARPRFYDLPIESGDTDTNEFFRNYSEIGPFEQVARNGTIANDLEHFFAKWKPGSMDSLVTLTRTNTLANGAKVVSGQAADELIALWAKDECSLCMRTGQALAAVKIAIDHGLVAKGCSAVLVPQSAPTSKAPVPVSEANGLGDSPSLQGANPEAITHLGADSVYIHGVNTAGTVRVNNLANLEAFLNILAHGLELLGLICGVMFCVQALQLGDKFAGQNRSGRRKPSRGAKLAWAAACVVGGLATPGYINWLVASARDANLFS